jgi:hypothetical protein
MKKCMKAPLRPGTGMIAHAGTLAIFAASKDYDV